MSSRHFVTCSSVAFGILTIPTRSIPNTSYQHQHCQPCHGRCVSKQFKKRKRLPSNADVCLVTRLVCFDALSAPTETHAHRRAPIVSPFPLNSPDWRAPITATATFSESERVGLCFLRYHDGDRIKRRFIPHSIDTIPARYWSRPNAVLLPPLNVTTCFRSARRSSSS